MRICPPTRHDHPPSLPETQSKQLPKADALRLIELALVNTANKVWTTALYFCVNLCDIQVDSQNDEVVRAKKSHFKVDLKVKFWLGIMICLPQQKTKRHIG